MAEQVGKIDVASIFKSDAEKAPEDTVSVKSAAQPDSAAAVEEAPATGKLAFMNTMRPALYKDLDRIFEKNASDRTKLSKAIKVYYRTLFPVKRIVRLDQPAVVSLDGL